MNGDGRNLQIGAVESSSASEQLCATTSGARERVIPVSVIRVIMDQLETDAATLETWKIPEATIFRTIVQQLREAIDNPLYVWVPAEDAAKRIGKSAETIRRYCRENRAPFAPFTYRRTNSNRYEIWLPDILAAKEMHCAA